MKTILLYILAIFLIFAGINHFLNVDFYERIMPPYLPSHLLLIYVSGLAEIICGALLFPITTRRLAAWLTIVLLIVIFPANIQMLVNYKNEHNPLLWIAVLRLPFQFVLIYWAWLFVRRKKFLK